MLFSDEHMTLTLDTSEVSETLGTTELGTTEPVGPSADSQYTAVAPFD